MEMRSFAPFGLPAMLLLLVTAVGAEWYGHLSGSCANGQIPSGSIYFDAVGNLLVDLQQYTPFNKNQDGSYSYSETLKTSDTVYYVNGQASCTHAVSDCSDCLSRLGGSIWDYCNNAMTAGVDYEGLCSISYSCNQAE